MFGDDQAEARAAEEHRVDGQQEDAFKAQAVSSDGTSRSSYDGVAVEDPFEVLGLPVDAPAELIRRRYRELVARHHPDRAATNTPEQRQAAHDRMASITAAFRMLNDPDELERFRRLERARQRGSRSAEPGRDGVHFRAKDPSAGGGIEPAPGDPDFDYRARAPSEFTVSNGPFERGAWSARTSPSRRRRPWR